MLLLYYCVLACLTIQIESRLWSLGSMAVQGIGIRDYYLFLNETLCIVTDMVYDLPTPYFRTEDLVIYSNACNLDQSTHLEVTVPDYIVTNWKSKFLQDENNFKNRKCLADDENCVLVMDFKINRAFSPAKPVEVAITSNTTQNENNTNSDFYTYVGIGGAILILILLIQTGCIISYNRKVKKIRRALELALLHRRIDRGTNERYSYGPIPKKPSSPNNNTIVQTSTTETNEEDNLYESLEHVVVVDKANVDTIMSCNIKNRPPLPLPHEMPSSGPEGGEDTTRTKCIKKPPLPLPKNVLLTRHNVKTLPYKINSHVGSSGFPEPSITSTFTTPRMRPQLPQNKPATSNIMNELNEIFSEKQNPHVDSTIRERKDSSEVEWTYEKLPPIYRYLR